MDDGTPIKLGIQIDENCGSAVFDFDVLVREVYGNTNAPVAITHSAIIYLLLPLHDQFGHSIEPRLFVTPLDQNLTSLYYLSFTDCHRRGWKRPDISACHRCCH